MDLHRDEVGLGDLANGLRQEDRVRVQVGRVVVRVNQAGVLLRTPATDLFRRKLSFVPIDMLTILIDFTIIMTKLTS